MKKQELWVQTKEQHKLNVVYLNVSLKLVMYSDLVLSYISGILVRKRTVKVAATKN